MKIYNIIILFLLFAGCDSKNQPSSADCSKLKTMLIGEIEISIPECYNLEKDSLNEYQYLVKNDQRLIEISTRGLVNFDEKTLDFPIEYGTSFIDTINNCYRRVLNFEKDNKLNFSVEIIDLSKQKETIFDVLDKSGTLNNFRNEVKLAAQNVHFVNLSKDDIDILTNAFRNCRFIESKKKPNR